MNLGGEELASLSSMGGEETLALPQCLRRGRVAAYPEHVQFNVTVETNQSTYYILLLVS